MGETKIKKENEASERFTLSSDIFEVDSDEESSQSENDDSINDDKLSDGSGFLVKIVQNQTVSSQTSSDECISPRKEDPLLKLPPLISPSLKLMSSPTRRIPATTHVHLFPEQGLNDETLSLPELVKSKTALHSFQSDTKGSMMFLKRVPNQKKLGKNLKWKQPLTAAKAVGNEECNVCSYRYYDFRKMTKPTTVLKRKRKRRKRKRGRNASRSRSRSNSRSRQKSPVKFNRKSRRRKVKKVSPNKRKIQPEKELCSLMCKEKSECDAHSSEQIQSSKVDTTLPNIPEISKIDVNKLTVGGFHKSERQQSSWQKPSFKRAKSSSKLVRSKTLATTSENLQYNK